MCSNPLRPAAFAGRPPASAAVVHGVELNRFAGLSGNGDLRDPGPDFCFHPQCEETEDDTPSATDDHRHAGAWLSPRTHQAYLQAIQGLARHYHQPPDRLDQDQISTYLAYLACERQLSASSCRQAFHAIRFLLVQVLKRDELEVVFPVPKQPQRIPELLTRAEVARILAACSNCKHHTMLEVCYGCGLRVSELCQLRISNIDGQRHLLRVTQGKGAKDRAV